MNIENPMVKIQSDRKFRYTSSQAKSDAASAYVKKELSRDKSAASAKH